jgi:hypothetical protein
MGSLLRRLLQAFGLLAFAGFASAQVGTFGASNQQAVTATATVLNIPAGLSAVCVKALPGNTSPAVVYVGASSAVTTSTGYPLSASESTCLPVSGGQRVFVIASGTGSSVAWLGTTQ